MMSVLFLTIFIQYIPLSEMLVAQVTASVIYSVYNKKEISIECDKHNDLIL